MTTQSYTMTDAQAARYDAGDTTVWPEILGELGGGIVWTAEPINADSVEILHPDGYVAQVYYADLT